MRFFLNLNVWRVLTGGGQAGSTWQRMPPDQVFGATMMDKAAHRVNQRPQK
jgi:hypothetical protein